MTEVAVVGAGLMGHALALVFALGGHQVRLTDSNAETLDARAGPDGHRPGHADRGRRGRCLLGPPAPVPGGALRAVAGQTVGGAKLVIEAIVERPDAKRTLYGQLAGADGRRRDPGQQHQQPGHLPAGPAGRCSRAPSSRTGTRRPTCATWWISAPGRRPIPPRSPPCATWSRRWARRRWCSSRWCRATSPTGCRRRCNWRCTGCWMKAW